MPQWKTTGSWTNHPLKWQSRTWHLKKMAESRTLAGWGVASCDHYLRLFKTIVFVPLAVFFRFPLMTAPSCIVYRRAPFFARPPPLQGSTLLPPPPCSSLHQTPPARLARHQRVRVRNFFAGLPCLLPVEIKAKIRFPDLFLFTWTQTLGKSGLMTGWRTEVLG